MTNRSSSSEPATLIDAVEDGPTDARYWRTFAVLGLVFAVDYFDFFIVGFLVADFAPDWRLTYASAGIILLAAGLGSIIGALLGGAFSDRFGRKPLLLAGNLLCGCSSGALALVPDGAWEIFAALRFLTGFAVGVIATSAVALIIERTPRRQRTVIAGLNMVMPSLGIVLASLSAGWLLASFGWRTVAALGAFPLVLLPFIHFFVTESVHWQVAANRIEDARRNASRILAVAIESLPKALPRTEAVSGGFGPIYSDPRRFWLILLIAIGVNTGLYSTYLWGPSILAAAARISPAEAAAIFAFASMFAVIGKVVFSAVPARIGRWRTGVLCLSIGTLSLAGAAFVGDTMALGFPLIILCFVGVSLFLDGGLANFAPYSAEVFPVQLASRGVGLSQAGSGVAKILGPISLALIAGSGDVIKPQATADAVLPAFLFLSAVAALGLIAMLVVRIETHGMTLSMDLGKRSAN